eukprot:tig00020816_g14116.t1
MSIDDLPTELLAQILARLSLRDRCQIELVSRGWRQAVLAVGLDQFSLALVRSEFRTFEALQRLLHHRFSSAKVLQLQSCQLDATEIAELVALAPGATEVDVSGTAVDDEALSAIAAAARGRLRSLAAVHCTAARSPLEALLRAPLAALESLDLCGSGGSDPPPDLPRLPSLRVLRLLSSSMRVPPSGLNALPLLEELGLGGSRFRLPGGALPPLPPSLRFLNLPSCGLKTLPDDLPKLLPRLESLCVPDNPIRSLPASLAAVPLTRLDLAHLCECGLDAVPPPVLALPSLTYLNLSQNVIEHLPPSVSRLSSLEARHTKARRTPFSAFIPYPQVLQLYGNKLRELPEELGDLPALATLNAPDNALESIPRRLPASLRHLLMEGNRVPSVPTSIAGLPHLTTLRLSRNRIDSVPPGALCGLPSLALLFLEGNPLAAAPAGLPGALPALQRLCLPRGARLTEEDAAAAAARGIRVSYLL